MLPIVTCLAMDESIAVGDEAYKSRVVVSMANYLFVSLVVVNCIYVFYGEIGVPKVVVQNARSIHFCE